MLRSEEQFIHAEIWGLDKQLQYVVTIFYASNQGDKRAKLWKDIEHLGSNIDKPWNVIGDFNNVVSIQDRIGGNKVMEKEYKELGDMMHNTGLFEATTFGPHFTWSNKHREGTIYSRIDHMLGNFEWFQKFHEAKVYVMNPHISDHAPIKVDYQKHVKRKLRMFKFLNSVVLEPSFLQVVATSWNQNVKGPAMYKMWRKLSMLQRNLKPLIRKYSDIQLQILKARHELELAQDNLSHNLFDKTALDRVKIFTDQVIQLNQMEETILMQKAKVDWLKLGDNNNAYFHASIREKNKQKAMYSLQALDGRELESQEETEQEILDLYGKLFGLRNQTSAGIDILAIRSGKSISREEGLSLIRLVTNDDIKEALHSIGNNKALGVDGFNAFSSNLLGKLLAVMFLKQLENSLKQDPFTSPSIAPWLPSSLNPKKLKLLKT
ncbi:uncharacterized protein LOC131635980 [Vicia villosa]|uniref:uncharacterized protein LOC131635980 n=1 Tax=Vicia villosa TaxID=3911 RepID=UPI00273AAC40|nr:uncharacterized protein LOC131635980 [Vicia villosa]